MKQQEMQQQKKSSFVQVRKKRTGKFGSSHGFTLLEILIVLAIVGVMAAALIPSIERAMGKSHDTQVVMDLTTLDSAARIYKMEHGTDPASVDVLIEGKYVPDKEYIDIEFSKATEENSTACVFIGTLSNGNKIRSNELGKKKEGKI